MRRMILAQNDPRIFILLPVHNRREITLQFIRCLMAQSYQNFHVLLIDDGSKDDTAEAVCALMPSTTVLKGHGKWWWAGSLQQGYQWLRADRSKTVKSNDLVLIANDDTSFTSEFLKNAVQFLGDKTRSLLLASSYSQKTGQVFEVGVHIDWTELSFTGTQVADEINCFSTRGLFMRVSDFMEVGGFHPFLLPHYLSDYEFTVRAKNRGMSLLSSPTVKLLLNEETTGVHGAYQKTPLARLRSLLTVRASGNPFYRSTFVLLSCPKPYVWANLKRIWISFLKLVVKGER